MGFLCLSMPTEVVPGCWKDAEREVLAGVGLEVQNLGMSMDGCSDVCVGTQQAWAFFFILSCSCSWHPEESHVLVTLSLSFQSHMAWEAFLQESGKPLVTLGF